MTVINLRDDNSDINTPDKSNFIVKGLPLQDGREFEALEQYAGQVSMMDGADHMFFWLVSNTTNTQNKDKLVLWLNGGPGCTSLDGMFLENGPYKFSSSNRLAFRDHSFTQQFDVLYIDQPLGTGFSVGSLSHYSSTFRNSTDNLLKFLDKFYEIFPSYKSRDLYISGESEAGTYIPYLANAILDIPAGKAQYKMGGIMIGNGWVDPLPMYMSYVEILREKNLLTNRTQKLMLGEMDKCVKVYNKAPQPVHVPECEGIPAVFTRDGGPDAGKCYNVYDLRLIDTYPECGMNWPPEVSEYTSYLNRRDVQRAINVDNAPEHWTECNNQVNSVLNDDDSPPSVRFLERILDNVPVLLFVGDQDFLCNYIGIEWMIGNLTWGGAQGFNKNDTPAKWEIDRRSVGEITYARGLTYAKVFDASHMVGVDRPREMLDLFTAFTNSTADNLAFDSTLRQGRTKILPSPEEEMANEKLSSSSGAVKFIAIGFGVSVVVLFLACFFRRKQLFLWWKSRSYHRSSSGMQRLDGDVDSVARNIMRPNGGRRVSDEYDDAFMMSEFAFKDGDNRANARKSFDVEGLLLDESAASSPDEEMDMGRRPQQGSRASPDTLA